MADMCCGGFATLSRAAAKFAASRLRAVGALRQHPRWTQRAEVCETCPMRVIHKGVCHCGRPFLHLVDRDEATDGCGCPCRAKAKDPGEHCPLDARHRPAAREGNSCNCKWCSAGA